MAILGRKQASIVGNLFLVPCYDGYSSSFLGSAHPRAGIPDLRGCRSLLLSHRPILARIALSLSFEPRPSAISLFLGCSDIPRALANMITVLTVMIPRMKAIRICLLAEIKRQLLPYGSLFKPPQRSGCMHNRIRIASHRVIISIDHG